MVISSAEELSTNQWSSRPVAKQLANCYKVKFNMPLVKLYPFMVEKAPCFEMGYKEFLFELFDQNLIFQEGNNWTWLKPCK